MVVSRRGAISWSMGMAVPICLLAVAMLADRTLHHAPPPQLAQPRALTPPQPPRSADAVEPPEFALPVDHLLARIRDACPNPDSIDDCSPRALTAKLALELPAIRMNRGELEQRLIDNLPSGFDVNIHALGFLRSRRALPVLREWLLTEGYFEDGWLTQSTTEPEIFFADLRFPRHRALIQAIESIQLGAIELTPDERRRLSRDAAGCNWPAPAQWLLHKLEGTPLPTAAESLRRERACARVPVPRNQRSAKSTVIPL